MRASFLHQLRFIFNYLQYAATSPSLHISCSLYSLLLQFIFNHLQCASPFLSFHISYGLRSPFFSCGLASTIYNGLPLFFLISAVVCTPPLFSPQYQLQFNFNHLRSEFLLILATVYFQLPAIQVLANRAPLSIFSHQLRFVSSRPAVYLQPLVMRVPFSSLYISYGLPSLSFSCGLASTTYDGLPFFSPHTSYDLHIPFFLLPISAAI